MHTLKRDEMRQYNMNVQFYRGPQSITVMRGCFAFMFTNVGDTIARVNQMIVFPSLTPLTSLGDSRSISGHLLDLYTGNMELKFEPLPGNVNPVVEIVQLFYITKD